MEYRMNLPLGRDAEMEGHTGDDFLNLEWTSSFHLEFLWSIHVEVGSFEPNFVSHFPRSELGGYSLFHLLLGNLVGSLGILSSSG